MKKLVISLSLALISTSVLATNADITNTMEKLGFSSKEITIENNPVKGLKSVTTPDGIFYVTDDGKFLTQGPIYNLEGSEPVNIANSNNLKFCLLYTSDAADD